MEQPERIELDPIEQRVVGALLEKERTVPDTYPMTLNGLRTACNQSSGRDPVMALTEAEVQAALDRLRPRGLTRVIHPSHGARQPKFRQVLPEVLSLGDAERAVVTLLLLRGPQTPGELRSRSDRLHPFTSLGEVEAALAALSGRDRPLVRELERQPGQKERRWLQLLGPSAPAPASSEGSGPGRVPPVTGPADDEVQQLRRALAAAEAELAQLRQQLDDLTAP